MPETQDLSLFVHETKDGLQSMELAVDGMHCAGCMAKIERGLGRSPGIRRARVNLGSKRVAVEWDGGAVKPEAVIERLRELGFSAYPFAAAKHDSEARQQRFLLRCLAVAAFGSMNIMLMSVSVWSGNATDITPEARDFFHWVSALIALPTAAYAGRPFYESALRALRARSVNMDVPITIGILGTLAMSVFETAHHGRHAYFDGAIMLLFFLLIGRVLDQNMRRKTRDYAENIAALKAETATKFINAREMITVPIGAIVKGDLVFVRPGERIAVDGVIEGGRANVDRSLVTGETMPVQLGPGAAVHAGTVNLDGALRIRVAAADKGTLLDKVNDLLAAASETRARYVQLGDRAARLYAPVVHLAAGLTFIGWLLAGAAWQQALLTAVTVLIITCPCALGLAIPVVQVVACGAMFRKGILLHGGDALERFAAVDMVVFDKTGTLTLPEATLLNPADAPPCLLQLAGRLALSSTHPCARALAKAVKATEVLDDAVEEPGRGVRAVFEGRLIRLGSPAFCGVFESETLARRFTFASQIAFHSDDGAVLFAIGHRLRPDARQTLDTIRAMGLPIAILSGDRPEAVASCAGALDVDDATGGLNPEDKIFWLNALAKSGRKVLMVGDGLNDAPALAAAHVSLSPVSAAQLSQAAADAVFLGDHLAPVASALELGRRARRLMLQNLWFAVAYNAIAVPLAIAGVVTPLIAALAMSGSSIVVTLNALRARQAGAQG